MSHWLDYPMLTDAQYRALKRSRDRTTALAAIAKAGA